jgi:outer membrane protein TolC
MKFATLTLSVLVCIYVPVVSQDLYLENYLLTGLENNLALQQRKADYAKNVLDLRASNALFYPDISLSSRYTAARGGRTIDFPVGDLLNPAYSTLNSLTESNSFPAVENQEFYFYRPTEQESRINIIQPLINPQLVHNHRIEKEHVLVGKTDILIYTRELICEIKTAYYNYLKAEYLMRLIRETEELLLENLRVSESLYKNDKVTLDVVYRSSSELQHVYLLISEAEKAQNTARAYFNFLLNKPLGSEIQFHEYDPISVPAPALDLNSAVQSGLDSREEIVQLGTYAAISDHYTRLTRSNSYPTLSLAFNYGFQSEQYSFTSDDDFILASIVLQWNLFHGFQNTAEVQKAKIARDQVALKQQETEKQIELQIIQTYFELVASQKAIAAALAQTEAAEMAFEVIQEKFRRGQSPLIEFIDSRTALTSSKQNLIISLFDYKIKEADLERAIAPPLNF